MPLPDFRVFSEKLTLLKSLTKLLPNTIPVATKDDKIFQVFTNIPLTDNPEEQWPIFNRRMDAIFGHELRDSSGRLLHVKRGKLGIELVLKYFEDAESKGYLNWDLASIKLDRLVEEFKILTQRYVMNPLAFQSAPLTGISECSSGRNREEKEPKQQKGRKPHTTVTNSGPGQIDHDDSGEESDKEYRPPKRARDEPPSPENARRIFDSDGSEIDELTEAGVHRVCRPTQYTYFAS